MQYGIKETKELIGFGLSIPMAYFKAKEDGVIDVSDLVYLWPVMQQAPNAIEGLAEVPLEIADLTDEEYDELIEYVKAEFDIPDDEVEEAIELAIEVATGIALLIVKFKAIFEKSEGVG